LKAKAKAKAKKVRNFDRRLWTRFWQIAKPYWVGEDKWKARLLLGLLVVLLVGRTEFNVLFNQQSGDFTSALAEHEPARFWRTMHWFGLTLLGGVPIYAYYYYVRDRLGVAWRRWLTHHFLAKYLENRAFYSLSTNDAVDNPDQRIAEDINSFSARSLLFLLEIVGAILQLIAFSGVLWSISRALVGILIVYAVLGTVVTFGFFAKPLIGLNYQQLRREADFRFGLIRIRENAEAIAFYRGEAREGRHVRERFRALYDNYLRLLRRTVGLNLVQYAYTFVTYALPSVVIAPRIISGELEVGRAVTAGGAFTAMLSALTVFVDKFETLSAFAAGIDRLHGFAKVLSDDGKGPDENLEWLEHPKLELENVTLKVPRQERTLVSELNVSVGEGEGLAIVGASGGGKSSLLRAVAGFWRAGSGVIRRPRLEDMLFLPQRPYMIIDTLRHQLLYPRVDREVSDAELREVLAKVNLPDIVERCGGFDTPLDFGKVLSLGEQQRLAVARVLLAKPRYTVLDEATSALDLENEAALYALLAELDTTLVSVTHRGAPVRHHRQVLELHGDGSWTLREVEPSGVAGDPPSSADDERAGERA